MVADECIPVVSNRQLMWRRFKKHRLALVSTMVLIVLYVIALFPEFFSTQEPEITDARRAFMPPQGLRFLEGSTFRPWVPAMGGKRNPTTLRMEWQIDATKKIPVRFLGRGYPYKALGILPTNLHLLSPASGDPRDSIFLLGTDRLGRDQWSRLMYATRTSMIVGLAAVALSIILGVMLGGISGYFGGLPDLVIQWLIELLQSLPTIPIWLALTAALPREWPPERMKAKMGVLRDYYHLGFHRMDDFGPGGAWTVSGAARGGLYSRCRIGWG
jgi:peptide/nickel transport system permease protein